MARSMEMSVTKLRGLRGQRTKMTKPTPFLPRSRNPVGTIRQTALKGNETGVS